MDLRPADRLYITVAGSRVRLVATDRLLGPEMRQLKEISRLAFQPWLEAIEAWDWDAWLAWICISMRRDHPTLTLQELEGHIGDTPVFEIMGSLENETPEVAQPDPPALKSDAASPPSGNGSGETIPALSTSAASGHQTSATPN